MVAVTPSAVLTGALDAVRDAVRALSPDDQTRVNYALTALEPVIADELDAVAGAYLKKLPVFGGVADDLVKSAVAKALDDGLAQLTAAKSAIGA
jgi:hypothetical protein